MNFVRYAACAALLCGLTLSACNDDEVESKPVIKPISKAKEVKTQEVNTQEVKKQEVKAAPVVEDEPALQPMVAPKAEPAVPVAPAKSKSNTALTQGESGAYVIQVGIQPSKKGANAVVKKLEEQGITAYVSPVEDPGELEGTYYRIRVGYFATIHDAQEFGEMVLEPAGFPWWVDNRANDTVGKPTGSDASVTSYDSDNSMESAKPAQVKSEPAPAEVPAAKAPMESAQGSVGAAKPAAPAQQPQQAAPAAKPAAPAQQPQQAAPAAKPAAPAQQPQQAAPAAKPAAPAQQPQQAAPAAKPAAPAQQPQQAAPAAKPAAPAQQAAPAAKPAAPAQQPQQAAPTAKPAAPAKKKADDEGLWE